MTASTIKAPPLVTLKALKGLREKAKPHNLRPIHMATLLRVPRKHYDALESVSPATAIEPWADEASRIAMILQTDVRTLLGVPDLRDLDLGFDPRNDLDIWRTGCRLPLSYVCRLCIRFGLPDPLDLDIAMTGEARALRRQVWSVVSTGERVPAQGGCPWCAVPHGEPHLHTCLADFLWGTRDAPLSTIGPEPKPRKPGRRRGTSIVAHGLRALRESGEGSTRERFAESIGVNAAYYGRLENGLNPLNVELAERIAAIYRVSVESIYAAPEEPSMSDDPTANAGDDA